MWSSIYSGGSYYKETPSLKQTRPNQQRDTKMGRSSLFTNNYIGTDFNTKHWLSLDPCGLICVSFSYSLHIFSLFASGFTLISHHLVAQLLYGILYIPFSTQVGINHYTYGWRWTLMHHVHRILHERQASDWSAIGSIGWEWSSTSVSGVGLRAVGSSRRGYTLYQVTKRRKRRQTEVVYNTYYTQIGHVWLGIKQHT